MTALAFASRIGSVGVAAEAPRLGARLARGARLAVGVTALALGGAVLLSAPVMASPACSGPVMMADAIVLPVLSQAA